MDNIDRSLHGMMRVNRYVSYRTNPITPPYVPVDIPIIPPTVPPVIPPIIPTGYVASDFGENIINNHNERDAAHAERCQYIFNYITKDFRDRCTSFVTFNTDTIHTGLISGTDVLKYSKIVKADLIFTSYVNAAYWMNYDYSDFVLPVGAHYDNNGQYDNPDGNNRHDITANANTFITNSVAVGARRDTPDEFKLRTSYGYGMEFFEDCSPEALNPYYPDKDVPLCFWECNTNIDGTILSNARTQTNSQTIDPAFNVGQEVWVIKSDGTKESTTITSFIDSDNFNISPALTPIVGTTLYSWRYDTLGEYINAQAESWAVPLVAAKLKVIKMSTNADWDTVRAAARATAKRNITNIPEIDNASWDIYRGFGCIDVDTAIQYINNL